MVSTSRKAFSRGFSLADSNTNWATASVATPAIADAGWT